MNYLSRICDAACEVLAKRETTMPAKGPDELSDTNKN